MRTAVVEVGTAALRAVVVEPAPGGWVRLLADQRVLLGLQRGVRRDGQVGEGRLQLIDETARRLRDAAFRAGAEVAVGRIAAGLADAVDLGLLRDRVATAIGGAVEVAGDDAEAAALAGAVLARTGPALPTVVCHLDADELRAVPVDATGRVGPSVVAPRGVRDLAPAGHVDPLHPAVRGQLRASLRELLASLPAFPEPGGWPVLVGDPLDALARAVVARRFGRVALDHDGTRLRRIDLDAFERELGAASGTERLLLPAVDPAEVDLATLGVLVAHAVVDQLDAEGVVVSRARPIEGVALAAAGVPVLADPLADATDRFDVTPHARHSARLAACLHDGLVAVGVLPDASARAALVMAATLHEHAGPAGPGGGHRRGADDLLRCGLRGHDPTALVEVASLVRFQRGRPPGPHFAPFGLLPRRRRDAVARATAVLRLACGLDGGRDGAVRDVHVRLGSDGVELRVHGDGDLALALHGAGGACRLAGELLGTAVDVRARSASVEVPTVDRLVPLGPLEPLG